MDHNEMVDLARNISRQEPFLHFASLFSPVKAEGIQKIRIGSDADGGYVMLDDFADIDLAISMGVDINADWDLDIANRNIRVQQYDHTVAEAPILHPNIVFQPKRIVASGSDDGSISIATILEEAKISRDSSELLKIDIEADEWPVFEACDAAHLRRFSQIVVEFHNFSYAKDYRWLSHAHRTIEKITKYFGVTHVHANNWSPMAIVGNVYFPDTLEVSFASRERYSLVDSYELFPTPLDAPNNPILPDLYLGSFRYHPLRAAKNAKGLSRALEK